MKRAATVALGLLLALLLGPVAHAYVPPAAKLIAAVARANRSSGRQVGLRAEVVVRDGAGREVARGELRLGARGEASLDVLEPDGTRVVQAVVAGAVHATRGGLPVATPRPWLPPLGLLTLDDEEALRRALVDLGVDLERVDLGLEGPHDCYVIGGRRRAPPTGSASPAAAARAPVAKSASGASRGADTVGPATAQTASAAAPFPGERTSRAALWLDLESYEPVRIDRADGVHFRFGPMHLVNGVRFPESITAETSDGRSWRLEFKALAPLSAPSSAPRARVSRP